MSILPFRPPPAGPTAKLMLDAWNALCVANAALYAAKLRCQIAAPRLEREPDNLEAIAESQRLASDLLEASRAHYDAFIDYARASGHITDN